VGILTWILTVALLVGLYFYWKTSSRPEKDEKKTNMSDTQASGTTRSSTGHDRDDKEEGGDSSEIKSSKIGGLQGAKLWHRRTRGESPSKV
jgi:hypothetical protein